jgi:nucleotide-binding universal stress UspA family protein
MTMKMLICSDGSEQAERAIRLGAAIATGCQAEVTLFGIVEARGQTTALLDSLKRGQALLQEKKIQAELITKSGDPIPEIIKRTEEANYDLVVIGAVRKESRGLFWMSSKSYKIIKAIKPPVLLVAGKSTALKRMLICSGGRSYIDTAVRLSGHIARGTGAAVTLLHVMPEPPALYARLRRMEENVAMLLASNSELGLNLRHEKETLEALGVPVEVRLRRGSVLEEILREIRDGNYDLVVTGSALSQSLRTYVLGNISREIVNRADRAVLVVRSHQTLEQSSHGLRDWLSRLTAG